MKVLVTGAAGFIGGYLVEELLNRGYEVVGLDNLSKYGEIVRSFDDNPSYRFIKGDASDLATMNEALDGCDYLIAGAAMIGGIAYFHAYAYDLLATNERICAATADAAIQASKKQLKKVVWISSSMVYESVDRWPSREGDELTSPPPVSSYGFQKLAVEFWARAAQQQYGLDYTIVRPFNCVGIGEVEAKSKAATEGDMRLALSHVVPDLVKKTLEGQDPLEILGDGSQVRHYTYGGDLAKGIVTAMEHPAALNNDFNLSTAESTTVLELARVIWSKLKPGEELRTTSLPPFEHDVQMRVPDVEKAKDVLGFEATTTLDEMLDQVIPWITEQMAVGRV